MKYTRLGNTGLKVSRICFGTMTYGDNGWRPWTLPESEADAHFKRAFELGINFVDTANMYSVGQSEEITGRMVKKYAKRDEVVIATKVFAKMRPNDPNGGGLSRKHIMSEVDASLRRLQTDYIDLYQIHRFDYETPMEETLEALHDCVKAGKVRYIGASSMWAWQFAKYLHLADKHGWTRFVSMQNHYNPIYREEEREMNPLCVAEGVGLIPWSPLARGIALGARPMKGGKSFRANNDAFSDHLYGDNTNTHVPEVVVTIAKEHGVPPVQIVLAWLMQKPGVAAPIIGTTKLHHLEEAVGSVEVTLSDEYMARIDADYIPQPVKGHS